MTSKFLQFYISNLEVLSTEIKRNRCSIQQLGEQIKTLTLEAKQKLHSLFVEKLHEDDNKQNDKIKIVYLLIRKIQKCEAKKRTLTRRACGVLDRYFESLDEKLKTASTYHNFNEDDQKGELFKTLLSIKFKINEPPEGNAAMIGLMKKIDDGHSDNSKSTQSAANVEVLSPGQTIESSNGIKESKSNESDLMYPIDNLQDFIDRICSIRSEMKKR